MLFAGSAEGSPIDELSSSSSSCIHTAHALLARTNRAPQLELRPNITSAASSHDADVVVFVDDEDRLGFGAAEQLLCGGHRRAATTLLMWRANLGPAERRRLTRAGRPCGLRLVCLAPRGANAECNAPPYKCIWCAYPAPAHAPAHGWTVAVYATPDETL